MPRRTLPFYQLATMGTEFSPSFSIDLPAELIQYILHLGASSSRRFCLTLCIVSSWTRRLATPHLLHTVILSDNTALDLFDRYITAPPFKPYSPDFNPASCVRNLWARASTDKLAPVLCACQHVTSLATTNMALALAMASPSSIKNMAIYPPRRLTIINSRRGWSWITVLVEYGKNPSIPMHTFLRALTHLYIAHVDSFHLVAADFPNLTHIAVGFNMQHATMPGNMAFFDSVQLEVLALEMLVLLVEDGDVLRSKRFLRWLRERRGRCSCVYVVPKGRDITELEWSNEVDGGDSVWERAVKVTHEIEGLEGVSLPVFIVFRSLRPCRICRKDRYSHLSRCAGDS